MGPARGSGLVVRIGERWRILQYNLTITVPNDRFADVKKLLERGDGTSAARPWSRPAESTGQAPPPAAPP